MKKKIFVTTMMFFAMLFMVCAFTPQQAEAKTKTYTIKGPNHVPAAVKKSSSYTSATKNWLQIQYYLKKLQKGGGKLVLEKGTYNINNTLYVPANTTIELMPGATLKKTSKTVKIGKTKIKPANNMFVLVSYNKKDKKNASKDYKGPGNIKFIGHGETSVIDLSYVKDAHGISASHNQNVTFEGLTFKGENGGHYIELAGTKNVTIQNNYFGASKSSTHSKFYNKEAINIDTADSVTKGFTLAWSKKDQTPNVNITITDNVFDGMNRAIGTHKYSQKKDSKGKYSKNSKNVYHQDIKITNNEFKNIYDNAIFMVNWKNTTIDNNTFTNIGVNNKRKTSTARHAIGGGGVVGITITNNTFTKVVNGSAVALKRTANSGTGSKYYPTQVYVTDEEMELMKTNNVVDCTGETGSYGTNSNYKNYDVLIILGDADRGKAGSTSWGINLKTKEIIPKKKK